MSFGKQAVKQASRQPRVLIVDDSSRMRACLSSILAAVGFECSEAADGCEAFNSILSHHPDLVITDLDMPNVDGFALLAAISTLAPSRRPPAIVVSARLDSEFVCRRPELRQAQALLGKPVEPRALLRAIEFSLTARAMCA